MLLFACHALASLSVAAAPRDEITNEGYRWQKESWSLTCDNLRTCRLVYGKDQFLDAPQGPHLGITLLFTQPAGAAVMQPLEVKAVSTDGEVENFEVEREWLDQEHHVAPARPETLLAEAAEARTLFAAVRLPDGKGETVAIDLSGLKAVLLKLDEVQHRAGTPLALIAKGSASAAKLLPPLPLPHVQARRFPNVALDKAGVTDKDVARLLAQVIPIVHRLKPEDDCDKREQPVLAISAGNWLLSQACASGAGYNSTTFWWLGHPVTPAAAPAARGNASLDGVEWEALPMIGDFDPDSGTVAASRKGRGIGDCSASEQWTYTQEGKWLLTSRSESGPCIGIPGGAWDLPQVTMDVQPVRKPAARR
jgi:hypothetical protein